MCRQIACVCVGGGRESKGRNKIILLNVERREEEERKEKYMPKLFVTYSLSVQGKYKKVKEKRKERFFKSRFIWL
jgi:hypothetical protein